MASLVNKNTKPRSTDFSTTLAFFLSFFDKFITSHAFFSFIAISLILLFFS
ncbi:hypothetical protein VCHA50P415_80068 [Vibrio chagasii]|nr:hypothetical protein VCHA27O13_390033 [Vibrio chagasii]CAH6804335.1 hypothetical protein VCHA34P129_110175 [Vibrio chagasii]CAH6814873.1 hypothetical protein VCHA30O60_140063 [Vibrio chagasii]CAH6818637.1 hypothetical protein VCHA34O109_130028 [Vibrio chagasii]CAH6828477.1 hypothetical protein VCHA34P120_150002 [Vibrio chagasii]